MHFIENISESVHYTKSTVCNPYSRWLVLILLNLPLFAISYVTDWSKIIAGTTIHWELIPWAFVLPFVAAGIVCAFLNAGYTVRLLKGGSTPPGFDNLTALALDGIKIVLIAFLWLLPSIALMFLQLMLLTKTLSGSFLVLLILLPFLMLLEFVIIVVALLFGIIGMIRFVRMASVREAFSLSAIRGTISRIGWLYYIFALVFLVIIGLIFTLVSWIISLIPIAGSFIVICLSPLLMVFRCRVITNVYEHADTAVTLEPVPETPAYVPVPVPPAPASDLLKWGLVLLVILALCFIPLFFMMSSVMPPLPAMTMKELEQTKNDDISVRSSEGYFNGPVFSQDGSHIFYVATTRPETKPTEGGYSSSLWEEDIWTMNRDGTNQTRLTHIKNIDRITKSPKTESFALTRYENSKTSVFILNDPGQEPVRLPGPLPYMYFSSWSPDGKRITATGFNLSDYNGYSGMPDGGHVPSTGTEWSRLYVMNADGTNPQELARVIVPEFQMGLITETSWSPDGTHVVAPVYEQNGIGLTVIDITTGSLQKIATIIPGKSSSGDPYRPEPYPRWSPDNRLIAFIQEGNVWIIKPDGSGEQKLTEGGTVDALAWNPDGSRLAFSADSYLGIIDPDGKNLNRVSNIQPGPLSWSPDGKTIVYAPGVGSRIRIMSLTPGVLKLGEYTAHQMDMMMGRSNVSPA